MHILRCGAIADGAQKDEEWARHFTFLNEQGKEEAEEEHLMLESCM